MVEYHQNGPGIVLEIDGILDLHQFSPKDVKTLVPDYLEECLRLGIMEVRIIHGKGKGVLRRSVHSILDKLPNVSSYRLDDKQLGNWGATVVFLRGPVGQGSRSR